MAEEFLAEQERRRSLGLRAELYDILGWSLPSLYNVDVIPCDRVSVGEERFEGDGIPAYEPPGRHSWVGWCHGAVRQRVVFWRQRSVPGSRCRGLMRS